MERKEKRVPNCNWSKHEHRVEIFKNEKGDKIRIDHFQVGSSKMEYVQFINTDEILTVTGDYGNWVFCRPFVPSSTGYVCDHYWLEKLKIASKQEFTELDWKSIIGDIKEKIDSLEEEGYEGKQLKEAKEWYTELLEVAESEDTLEYEYKAFRDYYKPSCIDYEEIPHYKEIPTQLLIIFDVFDEICFRLKEKEEKNGI